MAFLMGIEWDWDSRLLNALVENSWNGVIYIEKKIYVYK